MKRSFFQGLLGLCLLGHGSLARAQPAVDEDLEARRTAVALANTARERFDQGDFAAALPMFLEAERRAKSPVLSLYIARCLDKLGRLIEARNQLRAILAEQPAANEPEVFGKARRDAEAELPKLQPRIPTLKVELGPGAEEHHRIEVDGAWFERARVGIVREVDPGSHRVRLLDGASVIGSAQLDIAPGAREVVRIGRSTEIETPSPVADSANGFVIGGGTLLAIGGATLLAAGGTGLFALLEVSAVRDHCVDGSCPPEDEQRVDDAAAVGTASTVLFVVGGACAAVGLPLLVVGLTGEEAPASAKLSVGPGWLGVSGAF